MSGESSGSIAIVGGGLAGSMLAAVLARAGHEVQLFERETFPRDKVCGEFLSHEARPLLERSGAWPSIAALGPVSIDRARFTSRGGTSLEFELPSCGMGLSRGALDAALFAHAERSGARVHLATEVSAIEGRGDRLILQVHRTGRAEPPAELGFDLVIGAHGRRARLDHELSRRFLERRHPHLGLKQHHRPRPGPLGEALIRELSGHVEIHAVEGAYCGLSFVEGGRVNVCLLMESDLLRGLSDHRMPAVLRELASRSSALAGRLEALEPSGPALSVAQLPFVAKDPAKDGVLFVGDAAGMVAPFAGNGQAMALEGAHLLASLIEAHGVPRTERSRDRLGRTWSRSWSLRYRPRLELGRGLQALLLRGSASERALAFLRTAPAVTQALVRLTRSAT